MATLSSLVVNLQANTGQYQRGMRRAGRDLNVFRGNVASTHTRLLRFGALLGGGLGLLKIGKFIIGTNREFEKLLAQLQTVQGSAEGATAAFKQMETLASTTPFQIEQLTKAFIQLRVIGVDATSARMTALGDFASAFGTDIEKLAEVIRSTTAGETESLKRFVQNVEIMGDQVAITFGGIRTVVGKDSQSITDALVRISENNFAGAMAREMDTLNGIISNTQDNFGIIARQIGKAIMPAIKDWAAAIRDLAAGQGGFVETAVRSIGTIVENMGRAIIFVSGHPIMAQGGLVGLLMFGGRGGAVMAAVGAALDELRQAVFGSTTEFGKSAERVARLTDDLNRAKAATAAFSGIIAAGNTLSKSQAKNYEIAKTKIQSLTIQLALAERTLDSYTDRVIDGTGIMGVFGEQFINMGKGLQGFTLDFKKFAANIRSNVKSGLVDPTIKELSTMQEIGRDAGGSLIRGFIDGATSLGDLLVGTIKHIATTLIIGEFNKALGIESPSKAAALAGRNTILGYIKGLKGAATAIPAAVGGAFALGGASPAGAGAGGGTVVHQEINFNISALDGHSVAQVLRQQGGTIAQIVGDAAQAGRGFRQMMKGR